MRSLGLFLCLFHIHAFALSPISTTNMWDGEAEITDAATTLKTTGNGQPSFLMWELAEPTSMHRQMVELWIELRSIQNWFAVELRMSSDPTFATYASIPLNRYTDPEFGWLQENALRKVTLSLGEARVPENFDLTQVKYLALYAQDGGQGSLIVKTSAPKIVPAKQEAIVSLTFDDGDASQFQAAEMMHRFGLRGTAYIMAREIDQPGFLSLDQIKIMQNKMGWGLSGHHAIPLTDMTPSQLQDEMAFEINFLKSIGAYDGALHFAYPLGKTNSDFVIPQIRQFYKTARRASDGAETLPPADWGLLRAVNITPNTSAEWLKARIQKAKEQGEWLILMFHKIVPGTPTTDLEYNVDEFGKILEVIQETQVEVLPVHEVYESQQARDL